MEASPVHTIQYFDGAKQSIIPLFQRPYSWDRRDWMTLWEDTLAQYEESERGSHFMGAIVTLPVKSVPVGVTKHMVIDGQQRLTTLSIFLAAIRARALEQGDETTAGIVGDLLTNRHYKDPDDLKLVPTQVDRAAYKAVVLTEELDGYKESKIFQAYQFFLERLEGYDNDEQPISASRTLQAVQQSLQVVMINLGESDDPYLIFESLNHKGKPLTQADLVRNYVLMRFQHSTTTGGEQQEVYEKLWAPMESGLGVHTTEFLRHYGMRKGRNVRKGDIYTASKADFQECTSSREVRTALQVMARAARSYERFIRPAEEPSPVVAARLRGLVELDSRVFYPLMLRLYRACEEEKIAPTALEDALNILESFAVRRLACSIPTNSLNKVTTEACLNLPEEGAVEWLLERLKQGSRGRRWPTDDEFAEQLCSRPLYSRRRFARYLLVELEATFKHKEPVDCSSATIEHVMPQTLTAEWRDALGPDHADIHAKWLDTIGNLTLTGYNAELGNLPFGEKHTKLANTHFELSRAILTAKDWGAPEIAERGAALAERALKRWPRP